MPRTKNYHSSYYYFVAIKETSSKWSRYLTVEFKFEKARSPLDMSRTSRLFLEINKRSKVVMTGHGNDGRYDNHNETLILG